jgi:hypothetical protein
MDLAEGIIFNCHTHAHKHFTYDHPTQADRMHLSIQNVPRKRAEDPTYINVGRLSTIFVVKLVYDYNKTNKIKCMVY